MIHRATLKVGDRTITPRDVVKAAAERSGIESVRIWMRHDVDGLWEREAAALLGRDDLQARIVSTGATAEQVIEECATYLLLLATEAELRVARKASGKPGVDHA